MDAEGEFRVEDLIADEDVAITVTATGYIKRTAITEYRSQRRGGRGRIGMRTREEDVVNHLFVASTHSYILIFSDKGRCYWLKVHEIPDVVAAGKGKAIANLVSMQPDEKIAALLSVRELDTPERFIVMCTRKGTVKKTELASFSNPRAGGIIAIGVDEGDALMSVQLSDGKSDIFIGTRDGMAIRFQEDDIRSMGRTAYGVRGISLRDDDEVVGMEVLRDGRHHPDRDRERLRQADRHRRVPPAGPRRDRGSSTSRPASGTARSSASRACSSRRSCSSSPSRA